MKYIKTRGTLKMSTQNALTSVVTNVSGATALVSVSTSKTASMIQESASPNAIELIQKTQEILTTADVIAIGSFVVLVLSFAWNLYSTRRRNNIAERNYQLEREKFELMKKNNNG